jgi:hypothetical protein
MPHDDAESGSSRDEVNLSLSGLVHTARITAVCTQRNPANDRNFTVETDSPPTRNVSGREHNDGGPRFRVHCSLRDERQGIAIGRAVHRNADLIVLNKPTTAQKRRR